MKIQKYTLLILILVSTHQVLAQHANFAFEGSIEFEKSTNMHAQIPRMFNKDNESYFRPAFDQYKSTQPQFRVLKSTLAFTKDKTLFTPIDPEPAPRNVLNEQVAIAAQNNIIYTDVANSKSIAQKTIFEESFLVTDSVRKINWKITSETRDIAGYQCRRANAIIMDSIYVVAFYTDEIPVSGGPESFAGLPGMILGVALPHENVTWFAKMVTPKAMPANTMIPPKKGKPTTNQGLMTTMKSVMKNWGPWAHGRLKAYML
jgi:GLPGLI family protein